MDFPFSAPSAFGVLSALEGPVGDYLLLSGTGYTATSTTWGTNQRAIFQPVIVHRPITVYQMAVRVQTQAGNIDVGVYDVEGNRQVSIGATAMAAAGVQTFNITDTLLSAGYYYLAVLCNNSTAALKGVAPVTPVLRSCGVRMQDVAADNLPATATFAAMAFAFIPQVVATYSSATF